jgi:hypothetical protein
MAYLGQTQDSGNLDTAKIIRKQINANVDTDTGWESPIVVLPKARQRTQGSSCM